MIENIHILIDIDASPAIDQIQAVRDQMMIEAHQRGEHPWGSMRRECPLCQVNKP